jgi:flagellar hook-associated protein 2
MAGIQATGVGSNLDVTGLVEKLMTVERQPLDKLNAKEAAVQVKISAYAGFRGTLSTFQGTLQALADSSNYSVSKGTVDDTSVASLITSASAPAGSYSFEVQNLAKSQKLASGVFASVTDTVGTGSLTIQYGGYDSGTGFTLNGNRGTQTVQIDAAHSSLSGVRDAINAAKIGVSANIVNDGTGFRLVVSSKDTGSVNGLKISVGDTSDASNTDALGLSQLAYDPTLTAGTGKNLTQIMAADDARLSVDGLLVTKSSNTISDVIAGTTINLLKANPGSPTKLNITSDSSAVMTSVDAFVKAYNELNKTITDLTKTSTDATQRGALAGDATIRSVASQIRDGLTSMVSSAVGSFKALPQIGITFDRSGNLTLDKTKLTNAMKSDPVAVQSLFATAGVVDDPLVSYVGGTTASKAGTYALDVSQLATRGSARGALAISSLVIDSTNDKLSLDVNGVSTTVSLTQKTYATNAALIAEMKSKINGSTALISAKVGVDISENAGVLTLTSTSYGSTSKVKISGGTGALNLFGAASVTGVDGLDVTGTLGGLLATSVGQRLTGTGVAAGLKLDVLGGLVGQRGTLKYGVGIAGQLNQMIDKVVGNKGLIASKTESLQGQVKQIDHDRTALTARLEITEQRYKTQFNALDQQLTAMQSMSSYLAQQLASVKSSG